MKTLLDYFAANATQPGIHEICDVAGLFFSAGKVWSKADTKTPQFPSFDAFWSSLSIQRKMELTSMVKFHEAKAMVLMSELCNEK